MDILTTNGHASYYKAKEFLNKLAHPELYGIFGIYKSEEEQLYCVLPNTALNALAEFSEQGARSKE